MKRRSAAVAAAVGYVAGTLPSAEIIAGVIARSTNNPVIDPTHAGSGNPGAANVASLLGARAGAAVFGLDMGKAAIAGQVGRVVAGGTGANVAATAAVLGHCFPAQRGFRGGKGIAASFGQMLVTFPVYLPIDLALGAIAAKTEFWKQRPVVTVGATCGLWVGLAAASSLRSWPNLWGPMPSPAMPVAAAVSSAAIVFRFRAEDRRKKLDDDSTSARE